jgi:hypothetical protein
MNYQLLIKMKSKLLLIPVLSLLACWMKAENVPAGKALEVAAQYYRQLEGVSLRSGAGSPLTLAYAAKPEGSTALDPSSGMDAYYYVFNLENSGGFIIVSGDDRAYPVLGHADRGGFDPDRLPPAMTDWLQMYRKEIESVSGNPDIPRAPEWQALESGVSLKGGELRSSVAPLCAAEWDQGDPYNRECPLYNGQRSLTGCVATAMAIILKYHAGQGHPAQGSGRHSYRWLGEELSVTFGTYDWANMPNKTGEYRTEAQKAAVSRLMYHLGASINAEYSPGGTSAYGTAVPYALSSYFGFEAREYKSKSQYSDSQWAGMIREELDQLRPVFYRGAGPAGGHFFVFDGYSEAGEYHVNWGWNGTGNGHYRLTALQPQHANGRPIGSDVYFTEGQGMVTGIRQATKNADTENGSSLCITDAADDMGMSMNTAKVEQDKNFTVSVSAITNASYAKFTGQIRVALMDASGRLKEIVSLQQQQPDILPGSSLYGFRHECRATQALSGTDVLRMVSSTDDGKTWKIIYSKLSDVVDYLSVGDQTPFVASGTTGPLAWTLDSYGRLTISGTGAMPDYSSSNNSAPWYDYRLSISSVTIENSVTKIGEFAFYNCSGLTGITLPAGITKIEGYAFAGCSSLTGITIPASVTSIEVAAFNNCSSLTDITLPNNLTSIGEYAFAGCSSLTGITLPNSVTDIGGNAFGGCSSLTDITLPNSLTSIVSGIFMSCTGLTGITIPESVTSIESGAFMDCSSLTAITLPTGITKIGNYAFAGCSSLTGITLPNSVTSIESGLFRNCTGLIDITIPGSVTSIGSGAFMGCASLTGITLPESVTSIEANVFRDCTGLTDITIPNIVTSIGDYAFHNCSSLTGITLPNSVTSIGERAFQDCTGLTTVEVKWNTPLACPENVFINSSIVSATLQVPPGTKPLYEAAPVWQYFGTIMEDGVTSTPCSNPTASGTAGPLVWTLCPDGTLTISGTGAMPDYEIGGAPWYDYRLSILSVIIENGVTRIGADAFGTCSSLTSITIPESVTSIGETAFAICSSLTGITLPNGLTGIGREAFLSCTGLTDVTLPNSLVSIGYGAFQRCSSLASITLPESVTSIGEFAFYNCSSLTNITIPNGVTSIEDWTFRNCTGLTDITIPNSVTSIGGSAFYNCSSLTAITLPESVTSIGADAFGDCSSLTGVTIPASVTKIEYYAFRNCSSLTGIIIPASVTSIGGQAFKNCSSLTAVEVKWYTPLTCPANVFEDSPIASATLHVPAWTKPLYEAAPAWQGFGTIVEDGDRSDYFQVVNGVLTGYFGAGGDVVIPDNLSITDIGDDAFRHCSSLTGITIPNGVMSIGEQAFGGCHSLAGITIPNSVTSIGMRAFENCSSLRTITLPNNVTSIGIATFMNCSSLTAITIPERVASIEAGAFVNCSSLTGITIPESVTSIGLEAFYDCSSLAGITLPASVTSIEANAFKNCTGLTTVEVKWNTPLTCPANVFENSPIVFATLHVPPGTKSLYEAAPVWQDFRTIVEDASLTSRDENSVNIADPKATASSDIQAYVSNNRLYVSSPSAEQISVYSIGGLPVYSGRKDAGAVTFDIRHLPGGVYIIKGSSGWVRKGIVSHK